MLAYKKLLEAGHEIVCLITSVNPIGLSYIHGMRVKHFREYADALGVPIVFENTTTKFNRDAALAAAREAVEKYGADAVCTGDIVSKASRDFHMSIAKEMGLQTLYPLFGMDEETFVRELLGSGLKVMFKVLSTSFGLDELIGKQIDEKAVQMLWDKGIRFTEEPLDPHTVVTDGPMFKHPIRYRFSKPKYVKNSVMVDMIPLIENNN